MSHEEDLQPIVIKPRGFWGDNIPKMSAVITSAQGRICIRVDDPNNLQNWMEMEIPMEQLEDLHDATRLQELEASAEVDRINLHK